MGTKAAKEYHIRAKQKEGSLYAQVAPTCKMAEVHMLKTVGLQDQNFLLFMTTGNAALANAEVREYVQLTRVQELLMLKQRLAEEEEGKLIRHKKRRRKRGGGGLQDRGEAPEDDTPMIFYDDQDRGD